MLSDLDLVTPGETTTLTATQSPSSTAKASAAQNKTILVLNSDQGKWQPALLIDSTGRQEKVKCFSPDDTSQAYGTPCSLIISTPPEKSAERELFCL